MTDLETIRRDLLDAALTHIPFDGWTPRALAAAAGDLGLPADAAAHVFPRGVADLAAYFSAEFDRRMAAELGRQEVAALPVRDRVARAVRARLEAMAPHLEAVRRLAAYHALPGRNIRAARAVATTVDAIWRAAGDTSTDFNYYTKRGLLAPVYAATILYWLSDESEGHQETWAFLDRRIAEILKILAFQKRIVGLAGRLPSPARLLQRYRRGRSRA
ncbi:MAG: COQ9 family protein [Rhodospirillales bacterium]|jgi:ubiquinone biosynthesis protein COQ9|nr:COQ9 family protein [Rhodospirillales bacterium]